MHEDVFPIENGDMPASYFSSPTSNIAPKSAWLEDDPFLLGFGLFSGANLLLVYQRVTRIKRTFRSSLFELELSEFLRLYAGRVRLYCLESPSENPFSRLKNSTITTTWKGEVHPRILGFGVFGKDSPIKDTKESFRIYL